MIPKKSKQDKWVKMRELGLFGENYIRDYLIDKGITVESLNLGSELDSLKKMISWDILKKYPKIPDFIAKKENEIFLFDVKTKNKYPETGYKFIVNKRDYSHYLRYLNICPVYIYFVFVDYKKNVVGVFKHDVAERKYRYQKEWDENIVYDLSSYKEQIA